MDNTFFNQCLAVVSDKTERRGAPLGCPSYVYHDSGKAKTEKIDMDLWKNCIQEYDEMRASSPKVLRDGLGHITSFTSTSMETALQNHINFNLWKRVRKFVWWKLGVLQSAYAKPDTQQAQEKEKEKEKEKKKKKERMALKSKLSNLIMKNLFPIVGEKKLSNTGKSQFLKLEFKAFQEVGADTPSNNDADHFKADSFQFYLSLVSFIEGIPKHEKNTSTFLPLSVNGHTLTAYLYLFKWIADEYGSVPEDENEKSKFRHFTLLPLSNGFQGNFISIDKFGLYQLVKDIVPKESLDSSWVAKNNPFVPLDKVFDLNFTKNQSPGASVQTDGVALNIHYFKVVPQHNTMTLKEKHQEQLVSLRKIGLENMEIVGVDPGRRDLFTASHLINDQLIAKQKFKSKNYSNAEYRHDSGSMERMKAVRRRINKAPDKRIKTWLAEFPIKRTCDINVLRKYVSYLVPKLQELVSFFSAKDNKSWRFKVFSKKKSTQDSKIPNVILDVLSQSVQVQMKYGEYDKNRIVVAYGSAEFDPSSRGNAPGPTKSIKKALKRFGFTVVDMDEYLTSQKCCICHGQLTDDGIDKRVGSSKKKADSRCRSKASTWPVRRCTNDCCRIGRGKSLQNRLLPHSTIWNRDVNASYNMAVILRSEIRDEVRPLAFRRSDPNVHGR